MKRIYSTPKAEIEKFTIGDIMTTSPQGTGFGDGEEGTTMPDEF